MDEHAVVALAPDAASVTAARKLATDGNWQRDGASPAALWGECRGSGSTPYRTVVDVAGPAYLCSCPSRKFPCKHALALMLRAAAGALVAAGPPEHVTAWLEQRAAAVDGGPRTGPVREVRDVGAAAKRAAQRDERMADGLDQLREWLLDQVRGGLAAAQRDGYAPFDRLAARMVDAQLPGVAGTLRRLASVPASGAGWPDRLLQEYALLHLLAAAPRTGSGDLVDTVRAHLGVNTAKDDVLRRPGVRDRWAVLALRDEVDERLTSRRVWLRGEETARPALVLSYAAGDTPLDATLIPGSTLDADLHFYPGTAPLRALVGERHAPPRPRGRTPGTGLAQALADWAAAVAADPWIRAWPVVLEDVVPVVDGDDWWLVDPHEAAELPLVGAADLGWGLLAAGGGRPMTVLAEVVPTGLRPVTAL